MVDVTIRGAGIFGLSCAWEMAQRGARVRLLERAHVGAGASGGVVGALAPHTPERWNSKKAFQFSSLIAAEPFWAGVEAAGGLPSGYGRTGRLQGIADDRALDLARQRATEAETLWQGKATWQVLRKNELPAECASDWCPPSASGWIIHDTLTARLHPAQACAALAAAILSKGGEIVTDCADEDSGSGPVLWATGAAGLAHLSKVFDANLGGAVKGQAAVFDLDRCALPQIFADGVHIIPHADGTVAVGSTSEREFDTPDTTDQQLETLIETARHLCPALIDAPVIARWAGLRPRARSRAPMLGNWPDRPGHFIANGGFKIGFGMAPETARIMADLILEGHDQIPEAFRVEANFPK